MEDAITAEQARQETNAAIANEVQFNLKSIDAEIRKHAQKARSSMVAQVNDDNVRRIIVQRLKDNGFKIIKISDQPGGFRIYW